MFLAISMESEFVVKCWGGPDRIFKLYRKGRFPRYNIYKLAVLILDFIMNKIKLNLQKNYIKFDYL